MKWRVTQYDADDDRYVHHGDYRFKWVAALVGWTMAGPGPGGKEYYVVVREIGVDL